MKFYVLTDVHGFYSEMLAALEHQGFFRDACPHKLVICGDLFDRGQEAVQLLNFLLNFPSDDLILVRGNHEDLMLDLLRDWSSQSYWQSHHQHNGTVDTVCQLTDSCEWDIMLKPQDVLDKMSESPLVTTIIPRMVDFFETKNYVFVHGWVPCFTDVTMSRYKTKDRSYKYDPDWREAAPHRWAAARWFNGMDAWRAGVIEPGKTIVCGHWHSSYGHAKFEGGTEFEVDSDFSPFYGEGIIALDACTAFSGQVNCLVIEDEPA